MMAIGPSQLWSGSILVPPLWYTRRQRFPLHGDIVWKILNSPPEEKNTCQMEIYSTWKIESVLSDIFKCYVHHNFQVSTYFGGCYTKALVNVGNRQRVHPPWYHQRFRATPDRVGLDPDMPQGYSNAWNETRGKHVQSGANKIVKLVNITPITINNYGLWYL